LSLEIHIRTIPHKVQRYDTIGDWIEEEDGSLYIRVSDLGDWRCELGIALHELVEAALCRGAGITGKQVDEFDFRSDSEEPGDESDAPYKGQHSLASGIERMVIALLGVDWKDYEEKCRNPLGLTSSRKPATALGSLLE
jgi:hypothetical protein